MKITNEKQIPKVYFGLHMVEGVAEYREPGKDPYRIFVGEEAIKNMDSTFQGRPVFVYHVDEVNMDTLREDADGYVVRSFFNKTDGKHWVEFLAVSDRAHAAIKNGWKLSNAYILKEVVGGGEWHAVEYSKEVKRGEYEHLAIVPNPRYAESIILTPEQFKAYNNEKEIELTRLANSKDDKGDSSMLNFFKKTKVENAVDLEGTIVELPKSKKEISLGKLVSEMDTIYNMQGYANGDHMVKVGEEEMSVNDMIKGYMGMKDSMKNKESEADADAHEAEKEGEGELKPKNDESDDAKKKEIAMAEKEEKEIEEKKKNEADKKKKENFDKLKNAQEKSLEEQTVVETSDDKVARGKSRYGSN